MVIEQETLRAVFIAGLRDAHAMEQQALTLIDRQLERLENYPELAERLRHHRQETEDQVKRLDNIFGSLNETNSVLKDAALSFTGNIAALAHTVAGDEVLKNSIANFAFENFEAAAYIGLITMADCGSFGTATALLNKSLHEELDMAKWIEDRLPVLTREFLMRASSGLKADR